MKPLRMMVSTILVISCLLCLPKSGSINASIFDVGPINFDGSFNIQKGIDTNRDGIYNDGDKTVRAGDTVSYRINWEFNQGNDPLVDPYVYDTIPAGTHYLAGSATPLNDLSYSTDNGLSWTPGEPPDGSQAGTMFRWGPIPQGWTTAGNIPFDPIVNNALVSGTAAQVSLALDPNGRPCMAFSDYIGYGGSRYDIFFVKWDGTRWVGANGQPYDPLTGANANVSKVVTDSDGASLAIDKYGYPCIAWGEKIHPDTITSWEIFFVRWNGYMWVNAQGEQYDGSNANVSNTPSTSYGVSLAIDGQNNPNLVWYDYYGPPYSFDINFLKWDGTAWVNVQGVPYNGANADISKTSSSSEFPVLKLDSSGNPCVSWSEGSYGGYDVVYIKWNGTAWVGANGLPYNPVTGANANVSRNGGYSSYPSLCLDKFDNPNIVWHDYSYGGTAIVSVKWDGTQWTGANGMPYDPATGANGIVAMNAVIGGGPSNPTRLSAKVTCIDVDKAGNQCVSWWGNIAGNRGIYFARWDGTKWIGANKQPFDPITGANAYTGGGFDAQYTNFANAVSMAMEDNFDEPFIGWYNQTPDLYTASLIKYLPPTAPRSFGFSAIVEETPVDSEINNQAFSRHALDQGMPALSNNVAVKTKKPVKKAVLEITKKAKSFQYNIDDIFAFQITVRNIGNLDATNVVVDDIFPRELKYVSSLPSGAAGPSKIRYQVGTLSPGQSRTYLLKFSLARSLSFAGNCLTITNKASAMSDSAEPVAGYATISVCKQPPTKEIVLDVTWKGVNTKTNEARANEEIKLDLSVEGGAPPYEVTVNWDNGTKSTKTIQSKDDLISFENSYSSQGDFEVLITCVDSFGRSARQSRIIHIK